MKQSRIQKPYLWLSLLMLLLWVPTCWGNNLRAEYEECRTKREFRTEKEAIELRQCLEKAEKRFMKKQEELQRAQQVEASQKWTDDFKAHPCQQNPKKCKKRKRRPTKK